MTRFGRHALTHAVSGRWLSIIIISGSSVAGASAGWALAETARRQSAVVEVQALIDRGSVFRLYYNNTWADPQVAAIEPGKWALYRFPVPNRLTALRFDPSDAAGAHIVIKGVTVQSNGIARSVPPPDLQLWLQAGLHATYDPATATTRIVTADRASYMMNAMNVDLTTQINPLLRFFRLNAITLLWCGVIAGLGALALSIRLGDARVGAAVVAAAVASVGLAWAVAPRVLARSHPVADVSLTVGHESFFGLSKTAELRAVNAASLLGAALALVFGLLVRRLSNVRAPSPASPRPFGRGDALFLGVCVLLFALGSVPSATDLQRLALAKHHPDDFDSINFLLWQYLNATGSLPWRDYWFPYSGMHDMLAPLRPEIVIHWSHTVLLSGVMLAAGFILVQRSRIAILALAAIWIYLAAMGLIIPIAGLRYLLGVSLILVATVVLKSRRAWSGVALGLWAFYAFQEEVSQVIYAAPALLVLTAAAVAHPPSDLTRVAIIRRIMLALAVFIACAAVFIASLAWNGQFDQWWEFVITLNAVASYSSLPADVGSWFRLPSTIDRFLVFAIVVLLIGGALQAAWTRFGDLAMMVPGAVGLVGLMLLQKQVIRPGLEGQILAVPVLGLTLLVVQQLQRRPAHHRYTAWLTFSGVLLVTCFSGSAETERQKIKNYLDVTSGLLPDLHRTLMADETWNRAREMYFSPRSVSFAGIPGDEFASRVQALTGLGSSDNVFVLGDHGNIYLALRRPVAFHVNFYNQSPIFCQKRTLEWVDEHHPQVLFWDPQGRVFDNVPNPVRAPLLYNYAIAHFVPLGSLANFEVLRRRHAGEPSAVEYWRDKLGTSLDLGYIPASSRALAESTEDGEHKMRFVVARVMSPVEATSYTVGLQLAGHPYVVQFKGRAGVTSYPIAIDRLPFAGAGDAMGTLPGVLWADPGIASEIKTLGFSTERLY